MAPTGYIKGMALAFAEAQQGLLAGDPTMSAMCQLETKGVEHDAIDWFAQELSAAGLTCASPSDRLLQVFAIMLGLGMRESSGQHCEGRDMAANNVCADTAEAGLFQVSYNSMEAHPRLQVMFDSYRDHDDLLAAFKDGLRCLRSSWRDCGSGTGREFQALTKRCPKFAVLYCGLLLRHERRHWGPINRREVEITSEAASLFRAVQKLIC